MTSCGSTAASSVVARNPWLSISATSASVMSSTCDRPAISPATISAFRSRPVTRNPDRAACDGQREADIAQPDHQYVLPRHMWTPI